jgi:hypothetical protein
MRTCTTNAITRPAGSPGNSMHGSDDSMHGDNQRRADHPPPHERRTGRDLRAPAGAVTARVEGRQ